MLERQELSTGGRIRMFRTRLGLSQQDLATRMGVAKSMVGQWEIGKREPKVPYLLAIADAMGCSFSWLATGTGDPGTTDQPNATLLEACVEVAINMKDAVDVPGRAAALYCRACEAGLGVRKATRAECIALVNAMLGTR